MFKPDGLNDTVTASNTSGLVGSSRASSSKDLTRWPALMLEVVDYSRELYDQARELEASYNDVKRRAWRPFVNIPCPPVLSDR